MKSNAAHEDTAEPAVRKQVTVSGTPIELIGGSDTEWSSRVVERTVEFRCLSGDRLSGTWRGVPIFQLLAAVTVPDATTRLVFEAVDRHTACVPLKDMVDGLLALQRLDGVSPPTQTDMPRIIAPGLDGPHAVKRVQNIEPVSIELAEDPHDWEAVNLEPNSSGG